MSADSFNGYAPEGVVSLPPLVSAPLQSAATIGAGQFLFYNAAGDAGPTDGTVPGLVSAGVCWPAKLVTGGNSGGDASSFTWHGVGSGVPSSTLAGDAFTKADVCTPAYAATVGTIGKKSNVAGVNRPLVGLVLGLDAAGTPRLWSGPIAQSVARSLLLTASALLASQPIADASAGTATAETPIPRAAVHGLVTSVTFTGAAVVANATDYDTITISKRDGAGGAAVVIATYDTRAANQGAITAFVPAVFLLSAVAHALELLETDIVTLTVVKGGAGKVLTGVFAINGKAI